MSERSPPLCCTLTLIAMQGHQTKQKQNRNNVVHHVAHEKTFVGGDAHPNERRAAANKANHIRKP